MVKGEGRGWKKFIPTPVQVVKIFIVLVILHAINKAVFMKLPTTVVAHWPSV